MKEPTTTRSPLITLSPTSPSFTSISSSGHKLSDIAARVVRELSISDHHQPPSTTTENNCTPFPCTSTNNDKYDQLHELEHEHRHEDGHEHEHEEEEEKEKEKEYEFTFFCRPEAEQASPVSADDIFYNGKIKPVYPLTLSNNSNNTQTAVEATTTKTVRLSLRKLFDQETLLSSSSSCSSSSEDCDPKENEGAGGIERLPSGAFCVWAPAKKKKEGERRGLKMIKNKKSSKKWKLKAKLAL